MKTQIIFLVFFLIAMTPSAENINNYTEMVKYEQLSISTAYDLSGLEENNVGKILQDDEVTECFKDRLNQYVTVGEDGRPKYIPAGLKVDSPVGTGETTGHIATLSVTNTTSDAIIYNPGSVFIPSTNGSQPYIVPPTEDVTIPAEESKDIPLFGYCADVTRPPVSKGEPTSAIEEWVRAKNLPYGWRPNRDNGWMDHPGSKALNPITEEPLGHTLDYDKYPEEAADLLITAITEIEQAFDGLMTEGNIHTPFSSQPEQERETVIQQTFWIFTSAVQGDDYSKEDFQTKTIQQFEENTGQNFTSAPEEIQRNVKDGVSDFWSTFEAVGDRAKVLHSESSPLPTGSGDSPGSKSEDEPDCAVNSTYRFDEPDFDFHLSRNWEGVANKDSIDTQMRRGLRDYVNTLADIQGSDHDISEYGIPETPLSAQAYWVPDVVGGDANAYAWTVMVRPDQRSQFITSTEELKAEVGGTSTLKMTAEADDEKNCTTHVVIVKASRIEAYSYAFDPLADHVEVLRPIALIGNVAVEYLLGIARGTVNTLRSFLLDRAQEGAKKKMEKRFKELENEIREIAEDYIRENLGDEVDDGWAIIDWLLNEFQENPENEVLEMVKEELIESLGEILGIDDLGKELDNIEDLLEQMANPPFQIILDNIPDLDMNKINAASGYALAEGSITHTVGRNTGTAQTRSYVTYQREGLEDGSETISGGGKYISEVIVSDHDKGSLTAESIANGNTGGKSSGNGHAKASLSSFTATVGVAICYCERGTRRGTSSRHNYDAFTDFSYSKKSKYGHLKPQFSQAVLSTLDDLLGQDHEPDPADVESILREQVEQFMNESR